MCYVWQISILRFDHDTFDFICTRDLDAAVYDYLVNGEPQDRYRTEEECHTWSILGAHLVRQHPDYPIPLIIELEAGRGCVRHFTGGCSFCSEPEFGDQFSDLQNKWKRRLNA